MDCYDVELKLVEFSKFLDYVILWVKGNFVSKWGIVKFVLVDLIVNILLMLIYYLVGCLKYIICGNCWLVFMFLFGNIIFYVCDILLGFLGVLVFIDVGSGVLGFYFVGFSCLGVG